MTIIPPVKALHCLAKLRLNKPVENLIPAGPTVTTSHHTSQIKAYRVLLSEASRSKPS
jgi:hypothetical protein